VNLVETEIKLQQRPDGIKSGSEIIQISVGNIGSCQQVLDFLQFLLHVLELFLKCSRSPSNFDVPTLLDQATGLLCKQKKLYTMKSELNEQTSKFSDDSIPIVKALSTRDAVWQSACGSSGTSVTLVSSHTFNALALSSLAIALVGG
jgi:hypothetical protein